MEQMDYAAELFMHKFISEQIEEEKVTKVIVGRFTLADGNIAAQCLLIYV